MLKLNLGAQIHHFDGWVNQDIVCDDTGIKVELCCDAKTLPYADGEVDFIYAGHLLEHFYPDKVGEYLKEWHRVLRLGGTLTIVVPDFRSVAWYYVTGQTTTEGLLQPAYGRIYSYDREEEKHHNIFDRESLLKTVKKDIAWAEVKEFNFLDPPKDLQPFMGSHIGLEGRQVGVVCMK